MSGYDKKEQGAIRLLPFIAMIGPLWLTGPAGAEGPVYFVDSNLKAAVEDALWTSDPTPTDMLGLTSLKAVSKGIASLEGLEYAGNLKSLVLSRNKIGGVSALSGLSNLQTLVIDNCFVADLSPLSTLHNLRDLDVHDNGIDDISALSGLTNLERLSLAQQPYPEPLGSVRAYPRAGPGSPDEFHRS